MTQRRIGAHPLRRPDEALRSAPSPRRTPGPGPHARRRRARTPTALETAIPARPHALLPAALALAAALAAGCSADSPSAAPPGSPAPEALDSAALTALAAERPAADLPPSTQTTAAVAAALAAGQPKNPAPVGALSQTDVKAALAFTAELVAATRADRDYLCGPKAADPAARLGTARYKQFAASTDGARNRIAIETTIGGAGQTDDCGPLKWVGPGVVLGPQTWTVAAGADGAELTVRWTGQMGYALVDGTGAPEPWGLDAEAALLLAREDGRWRLDALSRGTRGRVAQGWEAEVPLPEGYLAEPNPPAGDPGSLKALRAAADAWSALPASEATVEQSTDGTDSTDQAGESVNKATAVAVTAPARGDADITLTFDGTAARSSRQIYLDKGRRALSEITGTPTAKPGKELPARVEFTERTDTTTPYDDGVSAGIDPFSAVALLAAADAAAPTDCPQDRQAASCHVAILATHLHAAGLTSVSAGSARLAGKPWLLVTVGLDEQGRPAFVDLAQEAVAFGETYSLLTSSAAFTAYPTAVPPPVPLPDPATVVPSTDVEFS